MKSTAGSYQAYAKLYINGVDTKTVFTPNSTYTLMDLGTYYAAAGDVFDLYLYVLDVGHTASSANSFQVTSNTGLIVTVGGVPYAVALNVATTAPSSAHFTVTLD
jgi:hypothetical protein